MICWFRTSVRSDWNRECRTPGWSGCAAAMPATSPSPTLSTATCSNFWGTDHGSRNLHADRKQCLADLGKQPAIYAELRSQQADRPQGRKLWRRFPALDDQAEGVRRQDRILGI